MAEDKRIMVLDTEFFHINWGADLGFILCMCWKWLGEKTVHCESITKYNDGSWMDDGPLVDRCARLIEQADMIVTYNGVRCDIPFLQTRLLINHKPLLAPVAHKDLYFTVRHKLKMSRNRLLDIQEAMESKSKKTPVRLMQWLKTVVKHDRTALAEIEQHCKQDVLVLEERYLELRPLLLTHPRLHGYGTCNKCGGVLVKNKVYFVAGKQQKITMHCTACGGYETRPLNEVIGKQKANRPIQAARKGRLS